jgi:hypothetical protein
MECWGGIVDMYVCHWTQKSKSESTENSFFPLRLFMVFSLRVLAGIGLRIDCIVFYPQASNIYVPLHLEDENAGGLEF